MSIGDWFAVVVLGLMAVSAIIYGAVWLIAFWTEKSGGWH